MFDIRAMLIIIAFRKLEKLGTEKKKAIKTDKQRNSLEIVFKNTTIGRCPKYVSYFIWSKMSTFNRKGSRKNMH